MLQISRLPIEKEIKNLKYYLTFIFITVFLSSIISISFQTDTVMALTEVSTECRGSDSETEKTESEDAHRFNEKGLDLLDSGKYQQAIEYFDMASDEDPNLAVSFNNKGNALFNLERYEEAIEQYDKAVEEDPQYTNAFSNKGNVLFKLERYEEAIDSYNKAVNEDPNFAQALLSIGDAYYNLGNYEEAINYYNMALDEDPNCDAALEWKNNAQENLENKNNHIESTETSPNVLVDANQTFDENTDVLSDTDNKTETNSQKNKITIYDSSGNIKYQSFLGSGNDNNNINHPPVANDASISTSMNQPLNIQLLASDKDNDDLIASIVLLPSNGVLSDINQENGMVTYTPNTGFTSSDSFMFKVNDGKIDSNSGLVTIAVEQEPTVIRIANDTTNNPPSAHDKSVTTIINNPIDITLPASDPDQSDELTASIVMSPSKGVLSDINQNTGVVTYTPNTDFASSDTFMFKVNDGTADSNSGLVQIAINQEEQEQPIPVLPTTSIITDLNSLVSLRDKGIITEEEFTILKTTIIEKTISTGTTITYTPAEDKQYTGTLFYPINEGTEEDKQYTGTLFYSFKDNRPPISKVEKQITGEVIAQGKISFSIKCDPAVGALKGYCQITGEDGKGNLNYKRLIEYVLPEKKILSYDLSREDKANAEISLITKGIPSVEGPTAFIGITSVGEISGTHNRVYMKPMELLGDNSDKWEKKTETTNTSYKNLNFVCSFKNIELKPGSYKADLIDGKKYEDNVYKCILNIGGEIPQDEGFFKFCSDVLSKIDISKTSQENYDKIYLAYYNDYIQKGFSPEEAHKLAEKNAQITLKTAQDVGYITGGEAAGKLAKLIPLLSPKAPPKAPIPPREVDAIPACEVDPNPIKIQLGEIKSINSYSKGIHQLSGRPVVDGNTALVLYDEQGYVYMQVFGSKVNSQGMKEIIWEGNIGKVTNLPSEPFTSTDFGNKIENEVLKVIEQFTGQKFATKHPSKTGPDIMPE